MRNAYIIIFCFFIFGIIIFLWNKFLNFWENKNFLELWEEEITTHKYNPQEDTRIFHWGNYIQDNWIIKYHDKILKNVDLESFEYLTGSYAKDKNNYFFEWKIIYISDGISEKWNIWIWKKFEILKWNYAKDENYLYYKNFWFLKHHNKNMNFIPEKSENNYFKYFVKIWEEIFYWDQTQNQIDQETFSHLEYNYFRDKNAIYYWNIVLALNINNYQIIDNYFIKDDRFVYLNGKYFPELDSQSFEQIELPKNHPYFSELYWDNNGLYSFNQYGNNFYKLDPKISKNQIEKCIKNQNLCKSMLWY